MSCVAVSPRHAQASSPFSHCLLVRFRWVRDRDCDCADCGTREYLGHQLSQEQRFGVS